MLPHAIHFGQVYWIHNNEKELVFFSVLLRLCACFKSLLISVPKIYRIQNIGSIWTDDRSDYVEHKAVVSCHSTQRFTNRIDRFPIHPAEKTGSFTRSASEWGVLENNMQIPSRTRSHACEMQSRQGIIYSANGVNDGGRVLILSNTRIMWTHLYASKLLMERDATHRLFVIDTSTCVCL